MKSNMKKQILYFVILLVSVSSFGQSTIEGTLMVDNTEKSYALYIPEAYDPSEANPMMLGLHPLNTNRWDAIAWRDTLIQFAEMNDLILVCPDGGPDGRIDDPIDTLFTSMLVDSISQWYTIDEEQKYAMGFSWGGRTTYTYGLRRTDEYKGLLAIGAAVDITIIQDVLPSAKDQAIYVLHGSQDAVSTRYTPIINALEDNGACLESMLMNGVGHTIDFPNRNNILTEAYNFLRTSNCGVISSIDRTNSNIQKARITPNPNSGHFSLENINKTDLESIEIYNSVGQSIDYDIQNNVVEINNGIKGIYYLSYIRRGITKVESFIID